MRLEQTLKLIYFLLFGNGRLTGGKIFKSYASRRTFIVDRLSGPVNILERVIREADSAAPMTQSVIALLNQHQVGKKLQIDFSDLHPKIVKRCKIHLANGQYDDAVLVAMKLVETELRETSGLTADDVGVHLVSKALGKDGVLILPRAKTIAEQEAVHQLFRGALGFFKNPLSHRFLDETDPHHTFLTLGFASILLTLIEQFERQPRSPPHARLSVARPDAHTRKRKPVRQQLSKFLLRRQRLFGQL